jgi:hypothetical protein
VGVWDVGVQGVVDGPLSSSGNPLLQAHLRVVATPARGHKCQRCWKYSETVSPPVEQEDGTFAVTCFSGTGGSQHWKGVCARCAAVLKKM